MEVGLKNGLRSVEPLQALNTELTEVAEYLSTLHGPLRELKAHTEGDLVSVIKEAIEEVRPLNKKYGHRFTVTLPRTSGIKVEIDGLRLALTTLLTSVIEYQNKPDTLVVHIQQSGRRTELSITAENLVLPEQEVKNLFTFSEIPPFDSKARTFHLRNAVVRELCNKQSIPLTVSSHPDTGTEWLLTVATKPEHN